MLFWLTIREYHSPVNILFVVFRVCTFLALWFIITLNFYKMDIKFLSFSIIIVHISKATTEICAYFQGSEF